jgi:predicted porin
MTETKESEMKRSRATKLAAARVAVPALLLSLSGLARADLPLNFNLYGFLNAEVESVGADGGATPYRHRGRVSDGNSRIGFSGSIDVDEHTRGLWQLEGALNEFEQGGVNDQGSTSTLTSRNSFVGISDDRFGQVLIGNYDSVYRSLVGSGGELGGNLSMTTHGLDLWNNTSAQMSGNANSVFSRGEARYKNSVHYLSPQWAGVQFGASYGMDEALANGANHDRFALAAKYTAGPFEIGVGFDHQQNSGADFDQLFQGFGFAVDGQNGVHTSYAKVVASYKLPTHTYLGAGYERASYGYSAVLPPATGSIYSTVRSGQMTQGDFMVSVAQDVTDKAALMFSYGRLGSLQNAALGSGGQYGATQFSFGGQYTFNSHLATYVTVTRINNKSLQSVNLGESPLYSNDVGSGGSYLAPGDSPRAVGIGLIARF